MDFILTQLREKKQYIKFAISGGLAASVDFSSLYLLHGVLEIGVIISATLAFTVAFFVSFYLQKFWTFRDDDEKGMNKQLIMYLAVGLTALVINAIGMHILTERFGVFYIFSQAICSASIAIGNFMIYKFVIFKKKRKQRKIERKYGEKEKERLLVVTATDDVKLGGDYELKVIDNSANKFSISNFKFSKSFKSPLSSIKIYKIKPSICKILNFLKIFFKVRKYIYWSDKIYIVGLGSYALPSYIVAKTSGKKIFLRVDSSDGLTKLQKKIVDGADKVIKG